MSSPFTRLLAYTHCLQRYVGPTAKSNARASYELGELRSQTTAASSSALLTPTNSQLVVGSYALFRDLMQHNENVDAAVSMYADSMKQLNTLYGSGISSCSALLYHMTVAVSELLYSGQSSETCIVHTLQAAVQHCERMLYEHCVRPIHVTETGKNKAAHVMQTTAAAQSASRTINPTAVSDDDSDDVDWFFTESEKAEDIQYRDTMEHTAVQAAQSEYAM